jgi:hypothetical protein
LFFLGDLEKSYNVNIECDAPERISTGICAAQAPNLIGNGLIHQVSYRSSCPPANS